jgi:hypothetical protein
VFLHRTSEVASKRYGQDLEFDLLDNQLVVRLQRFSYR